MLKLVTLLAAITQLLALLVGAGSFIRYFFRFFRTGNWDFLLTQPVYLLAHAALTLFLFVLFTKQK